MNKTKPNNVSLSSDEKRMIEMAHELGFSYAILTKKGPLFANSEFEWENDKKKLNQNKESFKSFQKKNDKWVKN